MEQQKIKNFSDLVAWQEGHALVLRIYICTKLFPADERFGLVSQMRRASVSITSNIAEGFGRRTNPDKRQFYTIAVGSIAELQSQLYIARDLGFLQEAESASLQNDAEKVYRLVNGLISFVS
jgi:four helix bundle protein